MIINEQNAIVFYQIVPYDTRDYIKEAFRIIWNIFSQKTQAIYTDNTVSDANAIQWAWKETQGTTTYPEILQDVWHALQRIVSVMSKYHPDYSSAKKELQAIFAKLQVENAYSVAAEFATAVKSWEQKSKTCSLAGKLNEQEQITYLGIFKF